MAVTLHSVGFFGSGKVDGATATALLNKDLPEKLGAVYRPSEITRRMATLSAVVDWIVSEVGEDGVWPSEDVVADLLERQSHGDEISLIAILPDEPTEDELAVLKDAKENDIRVKDLAKALDDVDFDVYFPPPADEPSPEATAEAAAAPVASAEAALIPDSPFSNEALLGALSGYVTQIVYRVLHAEGLLGNPAAEQVAAKVADEAAAPLKAAAARAKATTSAASKPATTRRPRRAAADKAAELPDGDEDTPPFDPPYTEASDAAKTYKYYVNPDGAYRLARGLPKRGEEIANLTQQEIDELTEQGLISEPKTASRK
jgi:hypothetical protein